MTHLKCVLRKLGVPGRIFELVYNDGKLLASDFSAVAQHLVVLDQVLHMDAIAPGVVFTSIPFCTTQDGTLHGEKVLCLRSRKYEPLQMEQTFLKGAAAGWESVPSDWQALEVSSPETGYVDQFTSTVGRAVLIHQGPGKPAGTDCPHFRFSAFQMVHEVPPPDTQEDELLQYGYDEEQPGGDTQNFEWTHAALVSDKLGYVAGNDFYRLPFCESLARNTKRWKDNYEPKDAFRLSAQEELTRYNAAVKSGINEIVRFALTAKPGEIARLLHNAAGKNGTCKKEILAVLPVEKH